MNIYAMIFDVIIFFLLFDQSEPKYFDPKWEGLCSCISDVSIVMFGKESRHRLVPWGVANSVTKKMFVSLAPCSFSTSKALHTVAPLSAII